MVGELFNLPNPNPNPNPNPYPNPNQVGELFNLPLVSECVDWARYVVRRHFTPVGGATGAM